MLASGVRRPRSGARSRQSVLFGGSCSTRNIKQYDQNREENRNSGFNIFSLISNKYYYKNLHSDIIAEFLNSHGKHKEGNKFLKIFIELIQRLKPDCKIDFDDFDDAETKRENHRVDILIQESNITGKVQ